MRSPSREDLLGWLVLTQRVVTADALHCQTGFAYPDHLDPAMCVELTSEGPLMTVVDPQQELERIAPESLPMP